MPSSFSPVSPGPLSQAAADTLNRALHDLYSLFANFSASPPLSLTQDDSGVHLRLDTDDFFPAEILGEGSGGDAGKYSWRELILVAGGTAVLTGGRTGSTTVHFARELAGTTGIAASSKVWLRRAGTSSNQQEYVFDKSAAAPSTFSSPVTFNSTVAFNQYFTVAAVAVSLSTTQHNYALTAGTLVLKITATADFDLTGLAGGVAGRVLWIENVVGSTGTVTLKHQSGSSTATNRLLCPDASDHPLFPGNLSAVVYNGTDQRWYTVGRRYHPREQTFTWTTNQDNLARNPGANVLKVLVDTVGGVDLTGVVPFGQAESELLWIENRLTSQGPLTIVHNATSTAGNRFLCRGLDNASLDPGEASAFLYDKQDQRWVQLCCGAPSIKRQEFTWTTNQNNLTLNPGVQYIVATVNSPMTLTGIEAPKPLRALPVWITNQPGSTSNLTVPHQDGGSLGSNQFTTDSGGNVVVKPGQTLGIVYNPASSDWNTIGFARVAVRKNSAGSTFTRGRFNLIEGANVTLTVSDDATNDEVDVTIAAAGGGGGPAAPETLAGARVFNSANISVASGGSGAALTFNSERFDTDNYHALGASTDQLTIPDGKQGRYLIIGCVEWAASSTGERRLELLVGSTVVAAQTEQSLASSVLVQSIATIYDLAVGDTVKLRAYQDSGAGLNAAAVADYSPDLAAVLLVPTAGTRVYNSAALTVSTGGAGTVLTFNSERYDTDSYHDTGTNPSRITIPAGKAGKYAISGHIRWAANGTGERWLEVLLNGSTVIAAISEHGPSGTLALAQSVFTVYDLAAGDYIELRPYQDSGGDLSIEAAGNLSPELAVAFLGQAFSGARAHNSANISVASGGSGQTLTLNSERFDTDNYHSTVSSTERMTVPAKMTGKFLVTGNVSWAANVTGVRRVELRHTAATTGSISTIAASTEHGLANLILAQQASTIVYLRTGDVVTMRCFQDSGAGLNVLASGNYSPELSIVRLTGAPGELHDLMDPTLHRDTLAPIFDLKGTLIVRSGNRQWEQFAPGTDRYVLVSRASESLGLQWLPLSQESLNWPAGTNNNLSSGSEHTLNWDSAAADHSNITLNYASGVFTIPTGTAQALYLVLVRLGWATVSSPASTQYRRITLYLNGTIIVKGEDIRTVPDGQVAWLGISTLIILSGDDNIRVRGLQNSGGPLSANDGHIVIARLPTPPF